MLDRMKDLGFYYSTRAGMTVGVSDIVVLSEKETMLDEAQVKVDKVLKQFRRGLITDEERYDRVIAIWSDAKDVIQDKLMESLSHSNPIYMMSDSGARGKDRKSTRLNSSHVAISYAVFCLKKKKIWMKSSSSVSTHFYELYLYSPLP